MPVFTYKARDQQGKSVSGTMDALTRDDLLNKLRIQQYVPVYVREAQEDHEPSLSQSKVSVNFLKVFRRIKEQDIVIFNMKLASMISAGVTLMNALNIIKGQIEHPRLKKIVTQVHQSITEGQSFSEALEPFQGVFSSFYISLIRAAELSGTLPAILQRLAVYLDQQQSLRHKVNAALFYPMILLSAGMLVMMLIVTFVFPKFIVVFDKAGVPLPTPTRILYSVGIMLQQWWWLGLIAIPVMIQGWTMFLNTSRGGWIWDRLQLSWPIFGPLNRELIMVRFSRTMATLIESGVPILRGLDIMQEVVGNRVFRQLLSDVRSSVEKGERISQPLKLSGQFPEDVVHMVAIGEETGKMDYMFYKIADYYEMTSNYTLKKLTTLIEPLLISLMGILVGFIMASMLMPLFDMIKTIQR